MCQVLKKLLTFFQVYFPRVLSCAPILLLLSKATNLSSFVQYHAFVVEGVLGSTNIVYIPIGKEITASNTNIHLKGGKLLAEKLFKWYFVKDQKPIQRQLQQQQKKLNVYSILLYRTMNQLSIPNQGNNQIQLDLQKPNSI